MLNVIINPINPTVIKFENEFDVGLSFSKMIYTNTKKNHVVFCILTKKIVILFKIAYFRIHDK